MNNIYKRYIKSGPWKRLRQQTLERDNFKCLFCNAIATDVHHKIYPDDFKNDCLDNLVSCCKSCYESQDDIVGYDDGNVIRKVSQQCVVCKKHFKEIELDLENNNWICVNCEKLKTGDNNGERD